MAGVGIAFTDLAGAEKSPIAGTLPRRSHDARFAIAPIDSLLAAEWAGLAARSEGDNVFFDPAFVLPALEHLRSDILLATVRAGDGRLIATAPLTRARLGRVSPSARLFGHDYAPLGAPLIERHALEAGAAGLVEGLAASGRSLVIPDLPLDGRIAAALSGAARNSNRPVYVLGNHMRAMVARPDGVAVDPRSALTSRRRKEFQRQTKKLGELGPVAFTTATGATGIAAAFDEFLVLEEVGWKGRAKTALLSHGNTAAFARAAVDGLAAKGKVRIDTLRVSGRPVAVLVSFIAGATAYTWKIAYDETFARFSPGALLMLEAGRMLLEDGAIAQIDSCAAADHPMVDHMWKDRLRIGTLIVGPPRGGLMHRAGVALAKVEIAARGLVRRLGARLG